MASFATSTTPCGLGTAQFLESSKPSGRSSRGGGGLKFVRPSRRNALENAPFFKESSRNSSQRRFAEPADGKPASPFTQVGPPKPTSPPSPFRKSPSVPSDWEKSGAGPASSGKKVVDDGKPASPFSQVGPSKPAAPTNPFRKAPLIPADWEKAGARPAGSGKRVLDAFKEGEKEGNTTKFGQPVVPKNIFDEVRRTPEEIAADAFKFEISPGQLVLAGSFLVVIGIMFGTVFLVWKVGAIHYNEY